jgi:hypothetical protein
MVIADPANAPSTGKISNILFFNHFSSLALTPLLVNCRGNPGGSNCGEFFSSS